MLGSPVIKACRDLGIQIRRVSCLLLSATVMTPCKQQHSAASHILQHVNKVPAHYQRFCVVAITSREKKKEEKKSPAPPNEICRLQVGVRRPLRRTDGAPLRLSGLFTVKACQREVGR